MKPIWTTSILMLCFASSLATAEEKQVTAKDVLALFHKRCIKCHGEDKPKAGLNLTSLETLGRGGKRGHVVVPGKPDDSLLWQVISEEKMPPKEPLPEAERALLKRWITDGSPGLLASSKVHWAFIPPVKPAPPVVKDGRRIRTEIDRFVLAALEKNGWKFAPEADRATIARRLCFDLTGL